MSDGVERLRAWLVTGPLGRGLAFAIDFGVALRTMLGQRRNRA
jgi:transketolase